MRLEVEVCGRQLKAIALGLEVDAAVLSRWLSQDCPDVMPSHQLPAWEREVGPGLWSFLEAERPGFTAPAPQDVASPASLLARLSGSTVSALIQHLQDAEWSSHERHNDLPGLRRLLAVVETLVKEAEAR